MPLPPPLAITRSDRCFLPSSRPSGFEWGLDPPSLFRSLVIELTTHLASAGLICAPILITPQRHDRLILCSRCRNSAVIASAFDVLTSPQVRSRFIPLLLHPLSSANVVDPTWRCHFFSAHPPSSALMILWQRGAATQTHPSPLLAQIVADLQV